MVFVEILCTGEWRIFYRSFQTFCVINSIHCESVECTCRQSVLVLSQVMVVYVVWNQILTNRILFLKILRRIWR